MRRIGYKQKQKGAVAILVAVMLTMLLSFAALALDVGNLMVSRNELQNAADAAALAAAPCLYRRAECGNLMAVEPDWATAEQRARDSVGLNNVQNVQVEVGTPATGYWNIKDATLGLQTLPMTPTADDLPAVRVTITKTDGNANKAVKTYLAGLFGVKTVDVAAVATAVIAKPSYIGPGGLFPIALSKCLFDNYWDAVKHEPKLATSTAALPGQTVEQVVGEPYKFQVSSSYHAGTCEAGQWTTFTSEENNVPFVRDLIDGKNEDSLAIGQDPGTYIQPGTENSLFGYVKDCSAAGNHSCEWGIVPVVDSLDPRTNQIVQAFACVHVLTAKQGSDPYVLLQMSANHDKCNAESAGGSGPDYGATIPPRLVQ
ncbi:Flp pilus-assembly TadG-like N-terminal domain-containing protein [Cupriavidus necator]|uniref:TadG family pilus assembly protein n=1 Tax=Cupriavidus necator TaxID=106590 RepID=UPI003F73ED64